MADTGSEIADGATRDATGTVSRILERELMMRITGRDAGTTRAHDEANDVPSDIEIGVRCPEGDLDARAEEVLEALERGNVRAGCTIDDATSTIALAISPNQGEAMLRVLERLSASRRSGFSIDDVMGVSQLEAIAGRRAIGSSRSPETAAMDTRGKDMPVESVALTFAKHPEEPSVDATQAAEYTRRMGQFGFDTSHRTVDAVSRDAEGNLMRTRTHIVGVSYLTRERDSFVKASGVALHEAGAAGKDDPYAWDHDAYYAARDEMLAGANARREAFARNRELASEEARDTDERQPSQQAANEDTPRKAETQAQQSADRDDDDEDHELTAEEYHAMPPRVQAKVDPSKIPGGAFGNYRASDVAREQSAVADAMVERAAPDRSHPSIGGR